MQAARQVGHGRQQMHVGGNRDRRTPDMVYDGHEMRVAECDDLEVFADPAEATDLGLGEA